jgi:DNA-binding protein YbaB
MTNPFAGGGGLGASRDPDEITRQLDQWAAGFAAKAERYRVAQEKTEQIRCDATSQDGSVRVTVRADGSVSDLAFSEKIRSMPLAELSSLILATMRRAQGDIANRVGAVMAEELGDEDPETRNATLANLRDRFPDLSDDADDTMDDDEDDGPDPAAPPPPPRQVRRARPAQDDDGDDEDFDPLRD